MKNKLLSLLLCIAAVLAAAAPAAAESSHAYTVAEVESLCECSRYRAMQIIGTLIEAGKLRAIGRRNSRHYTATEGHFGK